MERVADDVAFGLEGRAWPREAMIPRVPGALSAAGLAGFERRRTARLSGGEQQRLALAGALAPRPGLLVLDEPTANLDPAGAAAFVDRLAEMRAAQAVTIVLVEHRADLAWPLADVVLALGADGTPLALGAPGELLAGRRADLAQAGIWLPGESLPAPVAAPLAVPPAPEHAPAPLATLDRVEFSFTRGVPVLRGIDLAVGPGERVALLGPNGSGKSTLLRLLVGLLRPTGGSARLAGRDPAGLRPRDLARLAGYVTQDPERGFVDGTVEGELLAGLEAPERDRVGDVAAALGLPLDRFGARNPHTLSGGEQRRLSVATQLVRRPRLLALDEPTVRAGPGYVRRPRRAARRADRRRRRPRRRDPRPPLRGRARRPPGAPRGRPDRRGGRGSTRSGGDALARDVGHAGDVGHARTALRDRRPARAERTAASPLGGPARSPRSPWPPRGS